MILLNTRLPGDMTEFVVSRHPNALSEGAQVRVRRVPQHNECRPDPAVLADHRREATSFRASQIATHNPSDNTNITIKEAALLSRGWGARAPSDRTNGGSYARQAPSNEIRRCARLFVFRRTILH
jgi:hypothetical protein